MQIQDRVAKAVRRADLGVRTTGRFAQPISRSLRMIVIIAALLILVAFISIAAGLALVGVLLRAPAYFYGSLAAIVIMGVLIALIVKFKLKADEVLKNIKDLAGLTEFLLDELFESLLEGIIALGVAILILGGGMAVGAYYLEKGWMWSLALSLLVAGKIELVFGPFVYMGIKRLLAERIKVKAKEALDWAQDARM